MQQAFEFYEDLGYRPKRLERLFFCLRADKETAKRVARFGDRFVSENQLNGSRIAADRLHISLHHVGDYGHLQSKSVYAAKLAGTAVDMQPIEVELSAIQSFDGSRSKPNRPLVLVAEGSALSDLFHALGIAMIRNGLKPSGRFAPHMTLLYSPQSVPKRAIEPIRFVAKDFKLIHSRIGLSQYKEIGCWPPLCRERA